MREHGLPYNDEIQAQILNFMSSQIKHDYLKGSREINLDLTVAEAHKLYNANDRIRSLAESGALQSLHKRCVDQNNAV